mgnify:CR=1 FL=1
MLYRHHKRCCLEKERTITFNQRKNVAISVQLLIVYLQLMIKQQPYGIKSGITTKLYVQLEKQTLLFVHYTYAFWHIYPSTSSKQQSEINRV